MGFFIIARKLNKSFHLWHLYVSDSLTPGMLYQVARYFEHGSFVQFSNGHLNVSSSEIEAFLTMTSNSRIKQAMGVLRMWRNTKYPNSKLEQLFQKIEEGIEDGLLSAATRQMFIQLIGTDYMVLK